ncbi:MULTISPECIES: MerR family transcriptional regulator [unclassified Streptomyces]|uniref:MerR family transcriptional regulator n=1 Tax=unclassified Streptomyces TaxID=2593676 RepID=UPI0036ED1902
MPTDTHGPASAGPSSFPEVTVPQLYTAAEAAEHATRWRRIMSAGAAAVTPATIRKWASRGHLTPAGLDEHQRPLYAHVDVARAEAATRARALRLVGIPEHS